ncbi:MAG: hypothetical protein M1820_004974 [Bogoriella megaspora]|nr:MAG: hypothetical protein M1820_004974 [Bogoriella megaspora]
MVLSDGSSPFEIAIIGGGIGGLCCALFIDHFCRAANTKTQININVYEQAAQYKEIGAGVHIGPNAAKLLHQIGIGEQLNSIAGFRRGVWLTFRRFDNSAEILTIPAKDDQPIRQAPVARAEFLDLLVRTVQERNAATLHTGKICRSVQDEGNRVIVSFADGTKTAANLVVGCDGIHSNIRSQFVEDRPLYSGRIAYRGVIPIAELKDWWPFETYSVSFLGPGKHFLVFPISQNKSLNIVAFVAVSEMELGNLRESWTSKSRREDAENDYATFNDTVKRVIGLMPSEISKWKLNDREPLDQWTFFGGKIVLLGDAAHAMLPHQGAGAGQALEDGYILARAVADTLDRASETIDATNRLQPYTQLYQDVRLPRAKKTQQTAREAGLVYQMKAPELIGLSYDDCLPIVKNKLENRMKWIWSGNIDKEYEELKVARSLS